MQYATPFQYMTANPGAYEVKGSGGQKYLVARIARDRPDVLERMKQGEFLSVRQAAIAAGIVKAEGERRDTESGAP
jgi:hypothetical protein